MNLLAMRMEEQYARPLNRLMRHFCVTVTAELRPEKLGSLARFYATDLLLLGYTESNAAVAGTFELLGNLEAEPLLAAMPVAVAIGAGKGRCFDAELNRSPHWWRRVLPIDARDFASPFLNVFVRAHALRFAAQVAEHLELDLEAEPELGINFPWESP